MRKSTVALASFIAGALCPLLFGNQASTNLQPRVFAQVQVPKAIPVVPPLIGAVEESGDLENGTVFLDGTEVKDSTFINPTFEYGGGAYNLENVVIDGTVKFHPIGAARNTVNFLNTVGLMGCPAPGPTPNKPKAHDPTILEAKMTTAFHGDLLSPVGQK